MGRCLGEGANVVRLAEVPSMAILLGGQLVSVRVGE